MIYFNFCFISHKIKARAWFSGVVSSVSIENFESELIIVLIKLFLRV